MTENNATTTPADALAETKEAVKGQGRRVIRDSVLDTAAEAYGPFTVVEEVQLAKTEPKFSAWITGARGRNGFKIELNDGRVAIVGRTTVLDFIARDAVTNPEFVTGDAEEPVLKGILG